MAQYFLRRKMRGRGSRDSWSKWHGVRIVTRVNFFKRNFRLNPPIKYLTPDVENVNNNNNNMYNAIAACIKFYSAIALCGNILSDPPLSP